MTREPTVLTLSAPAIRYLRVRKRIILLLCLGGGEIGEKVGGPVEAGTDEEASGEIRLTAIDRKRTRLNPSTYCATSMPSPVGTKQQYSLTPTTSNRAEML